jgi:hypothetical protein
VRPGAPLRAPVPRLTGARCIGNALVVTIPFAAGRGFRSLLTLFGSYHVLDYNLFYTNIRVNAKQRALAYRAAARHDPA